MAEYSQEIYDRIIDMLALPRGSEKKYWDIEDNVENTEIYLIHYKVDKLDEIIHREGFTPDIDMEDSQLILNLRGLVIDLEEKWVCCRSFGFSSMSTLNEINATQIKLEDQYNNTSVENTNNITFQSFYGGPVVRVWKYKGKVYYSTHHKISMEKTRWGSSKFFSDYFVELFDSSFNTSSLEEISNVLFSDEKETSNFCHIFIISAPDLILGTRMNVGDGFLVYLKPLVSNFFISDDAFKHYKYNKQIENIDKNSFVKNISSNYPLENVDKVPIPQLTKVKKILTPSNFNFQIANEILTCGYSGKSKDDLEDIDMRLLPGEAILAILPSGKYVKISPTCLTWRNYILENNPNIYNQYCNNLDLMTESDKMSFKRNKKNILNFVEDKDYSYDEIFPDLGTPTAEQLIDFSQKMEEDNEILPEIFSTITSAKKKTILTSAEKREEKRECKDLKIRNISYCMLFAVPHNSIIKAGEFYEKFLSDLELLKVFFERNLKYLGEKIENGILKEDPRFFDKNKNKINLSGKYITRIINAAADFVDVRREKRTDMRYDPKIRKKVKMSDKELILDNINNLLKNEKGGNLYSLFKSTKKEL